MNEALIQLRNAIDAITDEINRSKELADEMEASYVAMDKELNPA